MIAHVVHLTPVRLGEERVPELVQGLDHREEDPEHERGSGRRSTRSAMFWVKSRQCTASRMVAGTTTASQRIAPIHPTERPYERARTGAVRTLGSNSGIRHEKTLRSLAQSAAPSLLLGALEQLRGVRRDVALEHVRRVELGQEVNRLVLGRRLVAEPLAGDVPDLLDRARAVHEPEEQVRLQARTDRSAR